MSTESLVPVFWQCTNRETINGLSFPWFQIQTFLHKKQLEIKMYI